MMERKWHIGIDIGLKGAICIMEQNDTEISLDIHPMPLIKGKMDYHKLHSMIENYEGFNGHVVFEKLGSSKHLLIIFMIAKAINEINL